MILRGDAAIAYIKTHSTHFRPKELKCKCGCGRIVIETEFFDLFEQLRKDVKFKIKVNSWSRCEKHNADEGGKPTSDHLTGQGVDPEVLDSAKRLQIISAAIDLGITRIGIAKSFLHLGSPNSANPQNVMFLY